MCDMPAAAGGISLNKREAVGIYSSKLRGERPIIEAGLTTSSSLSDGRFLIILLESAFASMDDSNDYTIQERDER
jgi:hypothetical protein